jgi:hypothetical protein
VNGGIFMALSKKEMEFANYLVESLVKALKENSSNSQPSAKGRKSANEGKSSATQKNASSQKSEKKTTTSEKKLTIADFEPKGSKCKEGYMNWSSYKSQRTKYCYFVATNGEIKDGNVFGTKWYGKVDFSENSKYYKAKEQFEKKYHYIKKEDRA